MVLLWKGDHHPNHTVSHKVGGSQGFSVMVTGGETSDEPDGSSSPAKGEGQDFV